MGLRQDAIASEAAAFTREELSAQMASAGLGGLQSGHATPLPYLQAYWMFGPGGNHGPTGQQDNQLDGQTRREAALLRWGFTAKPF
jgi:hypothetical protein